MVDSSSETFLGTLFHIINDCKGTKHKKAKTERQAFKQIASNAFKYISPLYWASLWTRWRIDIN